MSPGSRGRGYSLKYRWLIASLAVILFAGSHASMRISKSHPASVVPDPIFFRRVGLMGISMLDPILFGGAGKHSRVTTEIHLFGIWQL